MSQAFEYFHEQNGPANIHDSLVVRLQKEDAFKGKNEIKSEKLEVLETCPLPKLKIVDGDNVVTIHNTGKADQPNDGERQINTAVTARLEKLPKQSEAQIIENKKKQGELASMDERRKEGLDAYGMPDVDGIYIPYPVGAVVNGGHRQSAGGGGADSAGTPAGGSGGQSAGTRTGGRDVAEVHQQPAAKANKFISELEYIASLYNPFK